MATFTFNVPVPDKPLLDVSRLRIRCAICEKLVDHIGLEASIFDLAIHVTVRCHGAVDHMAIPIHRLRDPTLIEQLYKNEGVAFAVQHVKPGEPMMVTRSSASIFAENWDAT